MQVQQLACAEVGGGEAPWQLALCARHGALVQVSGLADGRPGPGAGEIDLENCMKACREVEVKQGSSKQHRTFRYWEAAHQANLFGGNERVELKPSQNHDPVPSKLLDNIFQPRVGVDDALRIADIMKAKFSSPNVASEKESWLEAELDRRLHSLGQLGALTDAWISSLFPEGPGLRHPEGGRLARCLFHSGGGPIWHVVLAGGADPK